MGSTAQYNKKQFIPQTGLDCNLSLMCDQTQQDSIFFPRLIDHFLLHLATLSLSNLDNNESENQLFSCCIIRPRYTKCQNNRFLMLTEVFQST